MKEFSDLSNKNNSSLKPQLASFHDQLKFKDHNNPFNPEEMMLLDDVAEDLGNSSEYLVRRSRRLGLNLFCLFLKIESTDPEFGSWKAMARCPKGFFKEPILDGFALITDIGMRVLESNMSKGLIGLEKFEGIEFIPQESLRKSRLSDALLYPLSHFVPKEYLWNQELNLIGFPVIILKITDPIPEAQPFPPELYLHSSALKILKSNSESLGINGDSIISHQTYPPIDKSENRRSNKPEQNSYKKLLARCVANRFEKNQPKKWREVLYSLKDFVEEGDKLDITPEEIQLTIAPGTQDEEVFTSKITTFKKDLSHLRKKLREITVTK